MQAFKKKIMLFDGWGKKNAFSSEFSNREGAKLVYYPQRTMDFLQLFGFPFAQTSSCLLHILFDNTHTGVRNEASKGAAGL